MTVEKELTAQQDYLRAFKAVTENMLELTKAKNTDYANSRNAFHNFGQIEILTNGRISTADGILTRLSDKMSRICNIGVGGGKVTDETVIDTLMDMAVYSVILKIFLNFYPDGYLYQWASLKINN